MKASFLRRAFACAAALLLATALLPRAAAQSAPVRVAYFYCGDYYKAQADGSVQSYDSAYLEALSEYTGLSFTYVDCGTWSNALKMLENGEIDLVGTMQKNAEREAQYAMCDYSYGLTATELAVLPSSAVGYEDYEAIGSARLGITKEYVRMPELEEMLREHGITPAIAYYGTHETLFTALEDGEIDIVAANSHTLPISWRIAEKFSYSKFYFAARKDHLALVKQLDDALIQIQLYRPNLQTQLQTQYFPGLMLEPYSVSELNFIAGLPALNVYINDGSAPLAYRDDDGNMTGILVELCELIRAQTGLIFNYCALSDKNEKDDQTCITVNAPDSGVARQAFVSDSFFSTDFNVYSLKERAIELSEGGAYRIVLPQNRQSFIDYLEVTYPDCEIVKLAAPEECIREVSAGRADLTMLSDYLVDNICKRRDIGNIASVPSRGITLGFVMISEGADAQRLTKIINKGIASLDELQINRIQFAYALNTQPDMTVAYFIKSNAVMVIAVAALLVAALCALIYARLLSRKNADIKKANAAKSDFLSTMSHDIRTPMNAIINIARLAQEDYLGEGGGDVMEDLKRIGTVSDFLMGLLNDILDMSSLERGKLTLNPEVYEYKDFLAYLSAVFEPLCEDKKIRFVCEPGETNLPLLVDRVRFNQVFSNLLSNAIKYTGEGGTVTYRVTENAVSGGCLRCTFEVSDTGCGMSEEFKQRMFEPFEREDATRAAYQGTGLGLSIAKNIVLLMGGEISVKSKQGEGTSFFVRLSLPIATQAQAAAQASEPVRSIEGASILIVEDNATNTLVLTRFLRKKGASVTAAKNGEEAVNLFAAAEPGAFDLILMDLRMPVMDGYEATRRIRAMDREEAKLIPILAMTADAFENDVEATKAAGMNAHLTKPVIADTLYQAVGRYLAKE